MKLIKERYEEGRKGRHIGKNGEMKWKSRERGEEKIMRNSSRAMLDEIC